MKLNAKEKRNMLIRIAIILVLILLFAYQNVSGFLTDRAKFMERDQKTVSLIAKSFGYQGNEDALPAIDFIDQLETDPLTYDQKKIVERSRQMNEESTWKVFFKRFSIITLILAVPYLIFEYFFNRA